MTSQSLAKEQNNLANSKLSPQCANEADEILHLKRLLVTMKQHYEKNLQTSANQLQIELQEKKDLQNQLRLVQDSLTIAQSHHEEELQALRNQVVTLKELLKKGQEELKEIRSKEPEKLTDEANLPTEDPSVGLRQGLEEIKNSLIEGANATRSFEIRYIEVLNEKIELEHHCKYLQKQIDDQAIHSASLENQLDQINQQKIELNEALTAKQSEVNDACESRNKKSEEAENLKTELNECNQRLSELSEARVNLERHCEQLETSIAEKNSRLEALDHQCSILEQEREDLLRTQSEVAEARASLELRIKEQNNQLEDLCRQCSSLEQEREELHRAQAEFAEARVNLKLHCEELEGTIKEQSNHIEELCEERSALEQEYRELLRVHNELKVYSEEVESQLKTAQQHLAKKVKESALLTGKLEEQEINLNDLLYTIERKKTEFDQQQRELELSQKEESRLKEHLQDALKEIETQIAKGEEKYSGIYDKLQESEHKIRELKTIEEKYIQMQGMFANFGKIMSSSDSGTTQSLNNSFHQPRELIRSLSRPPSEDLIGFNSKERDREEKFDIFGMRQPDDKQRGPLANEF